MRRYLVAAMLVCLFAFSEILAFVAAAQPQGEPTGDQAVEIKALQKERVETLQRLVSFCTEQYKMGHSLSSRWPLHKTNWSGPSWN